MGSYGSDDFYPTFDKKSKTANSTENCRQRSATLLQSQSPNKVLYKSFANRYNPMNFVNGNFIKIPINIK